MWLVKTLSNTRILDFEYFNPPFGGESGVFDDFGVGRVFKYSSIEILQSIWPYTQKPNGPLPREGKRTDAETLALYSRE
jgi:hypothetical protein